MGIGRHCLHFKDNSGSDSVIAQQNLHHQLPGPGGGGNGTASQGNAVCVNLDAKIKEKKNPFPLVHYGGKFSLTQVSPFILSLIYLQRFAEGPL